MRYEKAVELLGTVMATECEMTKRAGVRCKGLAKDQVHAITELFKELVGRAPSKEELADIVV